MQTFEMNVSPAVAQGWLDKNQLNPRIIDENRVNGYAQAMLRGEWMLTHQSIAIDEDGNLLDGQHRLSAVVKSGITCLMNVSLGVPTASIGEIDRGVRRNIHCVIGEQNRRVSEISAFLTRLAWGSKATTMQYQRLHGVIKSGADAMIERCGTARKYRSASPVKSGFFVGYLMRANDSSVFDDYRNFVLAEFDDFEILQAMKPSILALLKRLSKSDRRITPVQIFSYTLSANLNPKLKTVSSADVEKGCDAAREFVKALVL